jgi:leucine dehydrogenase
VNIVSTQQILAVNCDLLIPCAIGGTIHDVSIPQIKASIVAGVANNTLGHESQAQRLKDNNIIFLPDFALNAGALIEGSHHFHTGENSCPQKIAAIADTIENILLSSANNNISTVDAAFELSAEKVIESSRH